MLRGEEINTHIWNTVESKKKPRENMTPGKMIYKGKIFYCHLFVEKNHNKFRTSV